MLVFVYGTLKQGFPNYPVNAGCRVEGVYRTRLPFLLYVVRLPREDRAPWLLEGGGRGRAVVGQLFEVDDTTLRAMDRLEEVGGANGYIRTEIDVLAVGKPSQSLRAQVYLKQKHQLAACLSIEGPFEEYTAAHAVGYWLKPH